MPVRTSYYVILDANILIRDFWMTGRAFSYLLSHHFLQHRPAIPEIALLEARQQLRQRAEALLANRDPMGSGSRGNSLRLLRLFNYKRKPAHGDWDVDKMLVRWDKRIKRVLRHFQGVIIPTPKVDSTELVRRSLSRQKPFSPTGDRGFRDTLIWLSTLELANPDSRVSFVTANTGDFFERDSKNPHPDLLAEFDDKLRGEWKIRFHSSLEAFIAHFDSDRSTSAEALQEALISNTLSRFDLWEWLEGNLVDILGDFEFDMVQWAGAPLDAEAPVLVELEQLVAIDVPRVNYLKDEIYRFYCDLSFVGIFLTSVGYNAAETVVHPNQIVGRKNEEDSFWTDFYMRLAGSVLVAVDFDIESESVVDTCWVTLDHFHNYDREIETLERVRSELAAVDREFHTDRVPPVNGDTSI